MYVVYRILNTETGKCYYGSTKNPKERMKRHFNNLKRGTHHSFLLQEDYNKYGKDAFRFEVLENFINVEDAHLREEELINLNYDENYNISKFSGAGDLISYHPQHEELIEKISKSIRKRYANMSEEERKQLSEKAKNENNANYKHGKYCSDYKKAKMKLNRSKRKEMGLKSDTSFSIYGRQPHNKGKYKHPETASKQAKELALREERRIILGDRHIYCEGFIFTDIHYAEYIYHKDITKKIFNNSLNAREFRIATDDDLQKYPYFDINKDMDKIGNSNLTIKAVVYDDSILFDTIKEAGEAFNITGTAISNRIKAHSKELRYAKSEDDLKLEKFDKNKYPKFKLTNKTKNGSKVYCEGKIFNSMSEAAKYIGITDTSIKARCNSSNFKDYYFINENE